VCATPTIFTAVVPHDLSEHEQASSNEDAPVRASSR
jgi:hypothetical protein